MVLISTLLFCFSMQGGTLYDRMLEEGALKEEEVRYVVTIDLFCFHFLQSHHHRKIIYYLFRKIVKKVARALACLHRSGIVHRNVQVRGRVRKHNKVFVF